MRSADMTEKLARLLFMTGGSLVLVILALALGNMLLRALGEPLRGVVEISGYLGAAAMGLCLPYVQHRAGHIEGGLMHERLPRVCRRMQRPLTLAAATVFMGVLTWELADYGLFVHEGMERIDGWDFGYAGLVGAVALGCAVQALMLGQETLAALCPGRRA